MKKKILSVILVAAMASAMLLGCNQGSSKESGGSEGEKKTTTGEDLTFVIVPKTVHAWFDEVNKGAQIQADALSDQLGVKVKIDYRAPQKSDVVSTKKEKLSASVSVLQRAKPRDRRIMET